MLHNFWDKVIEVTMVSILLSFSRPALWSLSWHVRSPTTLKLPYWRDQIERHMEREVRGALRSWIFPASTSKPVSGWARDVSFFFLMFIYFWETESEQGRGRERGRHRIRSRLQAPSCQLRAWHRAWTHEVWDHDLSQSRTLNQLSHQGTPSDISNDSSTGLQAAPPRWVSPLCPVWIPDSQNLWSL